MAEYVNLCKTSEQHKEKSFITITGVKSSFSAYLYKDVITQVLFLEHELFALYS